MSERISLDGVEDAIAAIARGEAVVVVDDEDRENEGDLIFAAERATPELVAFMVRHTSGYICVSLEPEAADRLQLPPMVARNEDARATAYAVTVDAATGTTGISARSRAETITRLADPARGPEDFTRPGHVVPLRARPGGVLARNGHTEAAVDLSRLAGLRPAGALCEIVSEDDPTDMARGPELRRFADEHGLAMISIAQLIEYRRRHERFVTRRTETLLPTDFGEFRAYGYSNDIDGTEHVALVVGDVAGGSDVLVRVHSECLTGDVFASRRCDCGPQLHESMRRVQQAGRGVIVYVRGHEGRGIGLVAKLEAYRLQDAGLDTVDANLEQGLPIDAREYSVAGQILADLGVESFEVLSNNPEKVEALAGFGPVVSGRTRIEIVPSHDNIRYLRTKRERLGHDLPSVEAWDVTPGGR
ncbi:bifunctional 3,4-dihydroxy-2-butanone-4-phosphate synthase/GTP cyclohydrolase II [Corynebacterium liangguodongii]|uniref:Riboflavin biosynthesis protein RibBA n=1 Tax=Corynebacterium liangguodongii TaxID=2079535 RepID=A0A2S0WE55_9CORY|nr:bifunctional 3,4-dihydroxy-2-butanone-4-phosphate synthase/GTP cyclohydrolase II [Corynebacterium liangguodongii]AWB84063.1 bifunctional 3,4-dihydroxy-2-butanone-4-phosphate synthase/GTP cyclohydrolase II [Corynebacterium liangguodongii]PWC00074.1 bifunctional 3,4-dihydroxy-2-butanone-4-phosphate synthase/GTP cyclohydrolase II [Corynebacterium liangguodongii]